MYPKRKCENCGTEFVPQKRSDQKYCRYECGKQVFDKKRALAKKEACPPKTCLYCKKEFSSFYFHSDRTKFCSFECKDNYHKAKKRDANAKKALKNPLLPRNCKFCQVQFTPTNRGNAGQQFCSGKCKNDQNAFDQRSGTANIRAKTIRTCPICEKQFTPKKTLKEIYCSPYCRKVLGRRVYKMMQRCYENTNTKKADHSHKALGYSPNQLLEHLQSFSTWDGLKQESWHLDHIFPIIAFVRKGITDPKVICTLSNLQPLSGPDNCVKNDEYNQEAFDSWLNTL